MRGVVERISESSGFAAIRTESDEYTVAELLSDDLEVGDEVEGDLESLGGETWRVVGSRRTVSVYVQDIHATPQGAARMLAKRLG